MVKLVGQPEGKDRSGALSLASPSSLPPAVNLAGIEALQLPANAQYALAGGVGILGTKHSDRADMIEFTPPMHCVEMAEIINAGDRLEVGLVMAASKELAPAHEFLDLDVFFAQGFSAIVLTNAGGEAVWLLIPPGYFDGDWNGDGMNPHVFRKIFTSGPEHQITVSEVDSFAEEASTHDNSTIDSAVRV